MATAYSLGNTLLKIDKVSHSYDGKPVLDEISAEVQDIIVSGRVQGQIVGILGPSGTGKTTLFRIIAGLLEPTSGAVYVNGESHPVHAGKVGVVAQNYPLFEHRTVLSNLMLAAKQGAKDSRPSDKVFNYLTEFGLQDQRNLYPAQLSGGQRQRCAILQQILSNASLILMDEPFSGLDPIMLDKTCELIVKVSNIAENNTIIVVTHDITAACSVADHLWLLGKGPSGAKLVEQYNLIDRDLCWHPEILNTTRFSQFVNRIREEFHQL